MLKRILVRTSTRPQNTAKALDRMKPAGDADPNHRPSATMGLNVGAVVSTGGGPPGSRVQIFTERPYYRPGGLLELSIRTRGGDRDGPRLGVQFVAR
jgi:hypothetical protein